jgi:zinc-binding alcohol dehydrogenase/oxidoreductase
MKALILQEDANERIKLVDKELPALKGDEVKVRIQTAALNHRDQWSREGMYPGIKYSVVLGSDGCGIVEEVANEVDKHWIGKQVILNPNVGWGDNPEFPNLNYTILGMPTNGVFAEYTIVPSHRLHLKPSYLDEAQAAALPLALLTAYRAVFAKGKVARDRSVLITGIGGGVALFALQLALAVGAKVYVTSGSDEKLEKAKALGASFGVNYKSDTWIKELQKKEFMGFHTIIDGAGGPDFGELAKMIAPTGTMVVYGTTAGKPSPINLPRLFFSQATITGSTMGNDQEFKEALDFVEQYKIVPVVSSVRPLDEIVSAFDEMKAGGQFGKLVIKMG